MRSRIEITRAFLSEDDQEPCDTVSAFLEHASMMGFVSVDEQLKLSKLFTGLRDYSVAQTADKLASSRKEMPEILIEFLVKLSSHGKSVWDLMRGKGYPITDDGIQLKRAWGITTRPMR